MRKFIPITLVHFMLFAGACANPASVSDTGEVENNLPEKGTELTNGKADRWSDQDAPSLFSDELEYDLNDLPLEGSAVNTPWAGTYWPVH